jgi:hypothetical protein
MSLLDAWRSGWAKALIFLILFRWLKPTAIELGNNLYCKLSYCLPFAGKNCSVIAVA